MLNSRLLTPSELDRFIAFNQQHEGIQVDKAYLEQATCRIFYHAATPDCWLAGYTINQKPPFRCLLVFDAGQRAALLRQHHLREQQLTEITLLCRDRSYRWQTLEREQYYLTSIWDALRTGCQFILGATANAKLVGDLKLVLNQVLYDGDVMLFGSNRHGWVLYTARWQALGNILKHVGRTFLATPSRQ